MSVTTTPKIQIPPELMPGLQRALDAHLKWGIKELEWNTTSHEVGLQTRN